jgi:hypothetical protein
MAKLQIMDEKNSKVHRRNSDKDSQDPSKQGIRPENTVTVLQQQVGNQAVQRLLAQRSGGGPFDLDDETAGRINRERSGGQALDSNVQAKMSEGTGQDFSDVKVHTGSESHALNEQLSAKAFTTGSDIFFRAGAYDPGSSGGQELLAHELTHVVQQRSGSVGSGGSGITVNAPGDSYEQEADSVAKSVMSAQPTPGIQRLDMPEEEEEIQTKALQRDDMPEEEDEMIQKQELDDDEEKLNG